MVRPTILLAAALGAAALPLHAELTVLTVENRSLRAPSFSLDAGGKLVLASEGGAPVAIPAGDVVEIASDAARSTAAPPCCVVLTNGDVLFGKPGAPAGPDQVHILSPSLGSLAIPFDQIDSIRILSHQKYFPSLRPETARSDLLLRAGGDRVTGLLKGVAADQLEFDVEGKGIAFSYRDVAGVYLTRVKEPPRRPETLLAVVTTRDGSCVTGALEASDASGLRIRSLYPAAGQESLRVLRLPSAEFASLYYKNGRCVYLSDLEPRRVEEHAYIEPARPAPGDPNAVFPFPFRRDRTVDPERPRPLTLRGRVFRKGLGVHSRSALTYGLDGRYKRFHATIGIDDEAVGRGTEGFGGSVVFQVWIDGRNVFDSGTVTGRDPARDVDLPVEDARELQLLVDFGDDFDVLDHADWAGARLIR